MERFMKRFMVFLFLMVGIMVHATQPAIVRYAYYDSAQKMLLVMDLTPVNNFFTMTGYTNNELTISTDGICRETRIDDRYLYVIDNGDISVSFMLSGDLTQMMLLLDGTNLEGPYIMLDRVQ